MMMNKKKIVLFFGDSIIHRGFEEKDGFIHFIKPQFDCEKVDFIHKGIGGNKIYDLLIRLEEDILSLNYDVLVVNTGTNDVNHKTKKGTGTDEDKYERYLDLLLKKLTKKNAIIILCNAAVTGEDISEGNARNIDLEKYGSIARKLTQKYNVEFCDIRNTFKEYLSQNNLDHANEGFLTMDGVHFNRKGQELFVQTLLPYLIKAIN